MNLKQRVKELAFSNGLDYVGIAPVERFTNSPEEHKPDVLLPGARSVISMGKKLSKGALISHSNFYHRRIRDYYFTYLRFGYGAINLHFLDETALIVTRFLEKEGYIAFPIMASGIEDYRKAPMGPISHRHAAVAAGLGEFGWNNLFMTPDAGPRVRLVTVITTAELEPDPMYHGDPICDKERCKKEFGEEKNYPCARACTMKVLDRSGKKYWEVEIGGRIYRYAQFDKFKSMWASLGLCKAALGKKEIPLPRGKIGMPEIVSAMAEREPSQPLEMVVAGRSNYCGRCLNECPVGMPKEVLKSFKGDEPC
jgi:epoxyqueuosine reductase